ncbi:hypothetical protein [Devosia yakushimensis]|nr:hypothetical protein [Devosia yakushimensis]
MKLPFDQHYFSLDECEFVLVTRKFYPQPLQVVLISIALIPLIALGAWQKGLDLWVSAGVIGGTVIASLFFVPLLFQLRTGQLGAGNYVVGNITSVMGHVDWPPIWSNILAERAVTYNWSEIGLITLRAEPWAVAPNNFQLELDFHDGRMRHLRVPNLNAEDMEKFAAVLELIALRRGIRFQWGSAHRPVHYGGLRLP